MSVNNPFHFTAKSSQKSQQSSFLGYLLSPSSAAAYAFRVGTVGVYDKGRRVWRVKTKYQVSSGDTSSHQMFFGNGGVTFGHAPVRRSLHGLYCILGSWVNFAPTIPFLLGVHRVALPVNVTARLVSEASACCGWRCM